MWALTLTGQHQSCLCFNHQEAGCVDVIDVSTKPVIQIYPSHPTNHIHNHIFSILQHKKKLMSHVPWFSSSDGYGSIPISTIFSGMNIHLPAILGFTRGTRFWHTARSVNITKKTTERSSHVESLDGQLCPEVNYIGPTVLGHDGVDVRQIVGPGWGWAWSQAISVWISWFHHGKSLFLMGKTHYFDWAIFNSYVC